MLAEISSIFTQQPSDPMMQYRSVQSIPGMTQSEQDQEARSLRQTLRMREMIKELKKSAEEKQDKHVGYSKQVSEFDKLLGELEEDSEKEKIQKITRYNYKEVAGKIQRAKTAVSAAQAVISAKRKVLEVKRRISEKDGDPEELQLALTHAKRMEMAARKKRHHLELEELVEHTRSRDERQDELEEASEDIKQAMTENSEEEIAAREDAVFEERQDMLDEAMEMTSGRSEEASESMLSDINAMIAEYGEDLLEELEEQMEQLENMEIVDPHMSEEDLEELKRKHRAAESRAMVKADMDYLKGLLKHMQEKGSSGQNYSGRGIQGSIYQASPAVSVSDMAGLVFSASTDTGFDVSSPEAVSSSVDLAI